MSRSSTLDKKNIASFRTNDTPTVKPRVSPRSQSRDTNDSQYAKHYRDRTEREKRTLGQKEEDMKSGGRASGMQVIDTLYSDDESDDEQVGRVIQLDSKVKTEDSLRDINKKGTGNQRGKEVETNTRKAVASKTKYLEDDSEDDSYEDTQSKNNLSKAVSFGSKSGSGFKNRLLKSNLSAESDEEESGEKRPTPTKCTTKLMIPELRTLSPSEVEDKLYQSRKKKNEEPEIESMFDTNNRTIKNSETYERPTPSPRTGASKKSRAHEDLESLACPMKGSNWKTEEDAESRGMYQFQSSKKSKALEGLESKAKETLQSNKKSKGLAETDFGEGKLSDRKQSHSRTQIKRTGSVDSLQSRISAKQNNSPRAVDQEKNHRTPYKNVLSPKRPASAKRGQIQSDYDISSTFESHLPDDEMNGEGYHHRGTNYVTHEDAVEEDYHQQYALHKHRDGELWNMWVGGGGGGGWVLS